MVNELDSSKELYGLYKKKQKARKDAVAMMSKYGGNWVVVKLDGFYCAVEQSYLLKHDVKAYGTKWYRTPIIRFNLALFKLMQWLTKRA